MYLTAKAAARRRVYLDMVKLYPIAGPEPTMYPTEPNPDKAPDVIDRAKAVATATSSCRFISQISQDF